MKPLSLRSRILLAIAAGSALTATAACGSEDEPKPNVATDAGNDASADTGTDAGLDQNVADVAAQDADPDAPPPTPRRPFLVGAKLRSAEPVADDIWCAPTTRVTSWTSDELDATTRALLARAWLDDGLQEHASIAAFARFTMLLLSVSAPPKMVADAQRASLDEITHARDCFALARAYGAEAAGPGALAVHDTIPRMTLADVAELTAEEGCVGETLGAAIAQAQLASATDTDVRRALARIARDEARHAELAWSFVAWAIAEERRGREDAQGTTARVQAAIERGIEATRALPIRTLPIDMRTWRAHGRLPCEEARLVAERAIADVLLPSMRSLRTQVVQRDLAAVLH